MRRARGWAALAAAGVLLLGCTPPGQADPTPTTIEPTATAGSSPEPEPEPEPLAWGPTEEDVADATVRAAALTDEQLAGQVILARYAGTDPAVPAAMVTDHDLAGVILFAENIGSLEQVQATADAVQEAVAQTGRGWPGIVSVDNEGGQVQRLSAERGPWTAFPPFATAGAAIDADDGAAVVADAYEAMARELLASGITLNFAPVADVTLGPSDVTIGDRSAGQDPQLVAATVDAAIAGFAAGGVLSSIKHFPGHGSLTVDSHEALPVMDATAREIEGRDLVPFVSGIGAGTATVMVGHILVTAWDDQLPASMSPAAYEVLRDQLGFTGVAVTDGLDMGALTSTWSTAEIAVGALAAGADLLLSPADADEAHAAVVTAIAEGTLDRGRVEQAAGRVIALAQWQSRLAEDAGVDPDAVGSQASADAVAALVTAARSAAERTG